MNSFVDALNGNKLIEAIKEENFELAKNLILSLDINLDAIDDRGMTALMHCCNVTLDKEQEEIIFLLLEHGANPNIQDDEKYTALTYSFELNRPKVNYKLIEVTDLSLIDEENYYALGRAVYHGRKDLIDKICETAKNSEDIENFRLHLNRRNHTLYQYAQEKLDRIAFAFTLENNLEHKPKIKKKKI